MSSSDEESSEYIVPERESPSCSDEPINEHIQPKSEPCSSPLEICTKSTQTESDLLNLDETSGEDKYIHPDSEPYSSPDEACDEFVLRESSLSLNSNEACEYYGIENDPSLSCSVESEHQYSNNLSPKELKERLELVYSHLVEAKKKLKIEQQRNRRAKRTISKLKGMITDLQLQSLSQ